MVFLVQMGLIWLISLRTYWNQELIKTKAKVISYYLETGKPEILKKNASSSGTVQIYWVMSFSLHNGNVGDNWGFFTHQKSFQYSHMTCCGLINCNNQVLHTLL